MFRFPLESGSAQLEKFYDGLLPSTHFGYHYLQSIKPISDAFLGEIRQLRKQLADERTSNAELREKL